MTEPAVHADAPPGKSGKYARPERERRFLLRAVPDGVPVRRVLIEDRYLIGTRIRLRRMTDLADRSARSATAYKLTQKIPGAGGSPGLITTMYLSPAEYEALLAISAATLRKVRSSFPPFGVDLFEGPLEGLVLAEAEFQSAAEEAAFELSIETVAEVTHDARFTGGRLAVATQADVRELLVEFGIGA